MLAALVNGAPLAAEPVAVPSGLAVARLEVIWDEGLEIARFRFLAPDMAAPGFDRQGLRADMEALCRTIALPETRAARPGWSEVVISLSSEPIPFGETNPEVVQSFEGYRLDGERCIWMPF